MRFPLDMTYSWILPALLFLILLGWFSKQRLDPLSIKRRRISFLLRCLLFLLCVMALTEPHWRKTSRRSHVVWLVDVSRSLGTEAVKTATNFIASTSKWKKPDSETWIAFSGQCREIRGPGDVSGISTNNLQDTVTDIASALQFAQATFPPGVVKTMVLFSDGQETSGDLESSFAHWNAQEIRIHTVPVRPLDQPEVLVRSVSAPRQVKEDEPFRVTAELISSRSMRAEIEIFKNGARINTNSMVLEPGVNRIECSQAVKGEKVFEFSVRVKGEMDTFADNNLASTLVQAEGMPKVLLLTDKPQQARYLSWSLKQEGILVDVRPSSGIPMDLGDLQNYELVIFDNVPAHELTPQQMKLFYSYVRDFGGGFLMLGGDQSFGLGGYYKTPVEELLPVRCDFEKEKENPSLAMVLIIDKSGSMSGEKMELAKDAAKAAVELLSDKDFVGVVGFDSTAEWVANITSGAGKGDVIRRISGIQADGGTHISPAMELAYSQLSTTVAKLKHVILLTDGVSQPGPFQELTSQMAADQITVSTVAVGGDADQQLLEQIAAWGNGRYYFADNPSSVPQIFARETMTASKSAIHEFPFVPRVVKSADFLSGVSFESAPFLFGYVRTQTKPTSELWLSTEKGEPLFASWRFGLGQAGAFTSDARNRWAVEWLKWEGFGRFWAQVIRKHMRSGSLRHFPVEMQRQNGGCLVKVDALDENGRFLTDLEGELAVLDPRGRSKKIPLKATGPGRFEGWWPEEEKGTYHVQAVLARNGEPIDRQYLNTAVGYPDEFLMKPVNEEKLRRLALETSGKFDVKVTEILEQDTRKVFHSVPLWQWLVGMMLGIFLLDVALRRWPE